MNEQMSTTGYDYNGVVSSGIRPVRNSVIVTGNPKESEPELRKLVSADIPIYFYKGNHTDELVGKFKAKMVKKLRLGRFYESEKSQGEIIQKENPKVEVIVAEKYKAKVIFITDEWLTPSLALSMKSEGCDVILAGKRPTNVLKKTIKRIPYAGRMEVVKEADLIIYEDKSKGEASSLRKEGHCIIGGDKISDKLELDRMWASNIARLLGILVPEIIKTDSFEEIKKVIEERGGKWVLKQQGKIDEIKGLNFVSRMPDSKDMLDFLPLFEKRWIEGVKQDFVMQEKKEGHEMACGSFWNGHEFMKDKDGDELCYENWEHKSLFPGNLGESTGEQYTIIKCIKAKYSKLFMETLDKCRELLKKTDYRGYFDVNNIVTEKGAYFLEFTPRMGVPFTSGLLEIHKSSWYDFLYAIAEGEQDKNFEYDPRFCIVSWLYTKPFPFVTSHKLAEVYEQEASPTEMDKIAELISFRMCNSENILINFKKEFTKEDWSHIHPDGLKYEDGRLKIANPDGYILTVTGLGETPEEAGEKVNTLLGKIVVPKAFWRNDFDKSNYHSSKEDLEKWGYIISDDKKKQQHQEEELKKVQEKNEKKRQDVRGKIKDIIM